jgi:hypothetical protein
MKEAGWIYVAMLQISLQKPKENIPKFTPD